MSEKKTDPEYRTAEKAAGSKQGNRKSALEVAGAYLASRMRTVEEVRKRLKEKGYSEEEIIDAVNELIGLRYLDDYLYAQRYFEYNREKRRGSLRAVRELAAKGVDDETIRNARADFLYEQKVDEYEDALELALREVEDMSADIDPAKKEAKLARKLESRGFETGDVIRVLETVRRGSGDDELS